jgi:uncharacterized protein YkwD
VEADLFRRVNDERRARRIAPLRWDGPLAELAREWSRTMGRTGEQRHRDLRPALADPRFAGRIMAISENVFHASHHRADAGRFLHLGWMGSQGHRDNMLRAAHDLGGVGIHCRWDGTMWATQNFGSTSSIGSRVASTTATSARPVVGTAADGLRCP